MRVSAVSTECSVRKRAAATSRLVRPSATSAAIRRSASVSSPREGARPPMRASSARVCSAQSGAPSRSKRASASSSVARAAPRFFARRCVRPSASSVRAWWNGSVLRACSASARSKLAKAPVEIAPRGEQQPAAAGEDRERPGPVERVGALLPGCEDLVGLVELADGDQRLEQVAELQALCRLEHEGVAKLVRASAGAGAPLRRLRARARRSRAPSRGPTARCRCPRLRRGRLRACDLARASSIRPRCAAMMAAGNSCGGISAAELRPEVQRVGRVSVGLLPVPRPPLEEAQVPAALLPLPRGRSAPSRRSGLVEERPVRGRRPLTSRAANRDATSDRRRAATRAAIARARAPLPSPRVGMPRPVLKCMTAVGRERAAAERGVADARGGADGELAVLDAALDAFAATASARRG